MQPITVNHGKAFGHSNWYTFYCPACSIQTSAGQEKCKCGLTILWPKDKE